MRDRAGRAFVLPVGQRSTRELQLGYSSSKSRLVRDMRWLAQSRRVRSEILVGLLGGALVWAAFNSAAVSPPAPTEGSRQVDVEPPRASAPAEAAPKPSTTAATGKRGVEDLITGPVLAESDPVLVSIPRLGVRSGLERLEIDGVGAMEVPRDAAALGWYALGPTPGALGPAVIAGHVTWDQAPAVFFRLGELRPGDRVTVAREDGKRAVFSVSRIATYPKTRFPTRAVFGAVDHAGLRLITCGGEYDHSTRRYLDNVVVFATLVAVRSVDS